MKYLFRISSCCLLSLMIFFAFGCNHDSNNAKEDTFSAKPKNELLENENKRICTINRVAFIANELNHVYTNVDPLPTYKTGITEMNKFITNTINYPEWEKDNHIQGNVYVQFVVEKDGSLNEFVVVRVPKDSKNLGKEAVRVIKLMPKWSPGKIGGHVVRTNYTLPIKFSLYGGYTISHLRQILNCR